MIPNKKTKTKKIEMSVNCKENFFNFIPNKTHVTKQNFDFTE